MIPWFFPKLWISNAPGYRNYMKKIHQWKISPVNLLNRYLGKNLNFHSNLLAKLSLILIFPCYYHEIFCNCYKFFSVISTIMSPFLWFNKYRLIEKQSFLFPTMSNNGLNYVAQLFPNNREIKDWKTIKLEFNSENKFYFSWTQLIDYILWITLLYCYIIILLYIMEIFKMTKVIQ